MLCDLPCVKYPTLPSNGINKTHATNSNGLWGIAGTCYRQLWIIHMGMVRWSITYPLCGWSSIVDSIMCRVCFMGIIHMVLIRWTQFLTHSKATCLCLFFLRYSYPRNCHLENSHRPWKSPVFSGNEWTWIFQPLAESMWMYVYVCMYVCTSYNHTSNQWPCETGPALHRQSSLEAVQLATGRNWAARREAVQTKKIQTYPRVI